MQLKHTSMYSHSIYIYLLSSRPINQLIKHIYQTMTGRIKCKSIHISTTAPQQQQPIVAAVTNNNNNNNSDINEL